MLEAIYDGGPLGLQSNFARANDMDIAALASRGYITSISADGFPTRQWRLTPKGAFYVNLETM